MSTPDGAKPTGAQPTQTELEMAAGRKAVERRDGSAASSEKANVTADGDPPPFVEGDPVETGIVQAITAMLTKPEGDSGETLIAGKSCPMPVAVSGPRFRDFTQH